MSSDAFGMGTDDCASDDVVVNTDLFALGVAKTAVIDFCPGRLSIGKFSGGISVAVMLADGVTLLTAEDAADEVRLPAA